MKAFETTATVLTTGEIRVAGISLTPGTEVDVIVTPKRQAADDFRRNWELVCQQLRAQPQLRDISDAEIETEITAHRA
jgi:hypothetical protein